MLAGSALIMFLILLLLFWIVGHKWILPLIIKNYGSTKSRNSKYDKEIKKIDKRFK